MVKLRFKRILLFACILWQSYNVIAQSTFVPYNQDYQHLIERYRISAGRFWGGHPGIKPFERSQIEALTDSLLKNGSNISKSDNFNLTYLKEDNFEHVEDWATVWILLVIRKDLFYPTFIQKNLLCITNAQRMQILFSCFSSALFFRRKGWRSHNFYQYRGAEVRGAIAGKIGFYSFIGENQLSFPEYARQKVNQIDAVPNEGFYKKLIPQDLILLLPLDM